MGRTAGYALQKSISRRLAANELVATIYDRMPAIIPIEQHIRWLGAEADPSDLLKPFPADQMKIFRRGY
jgi:putative SOS response-associated peptidase YedK